MDRGYFVKPTVFADVRNDMTIAKEEIFGPVLSILTYRDEEEAIRLANASDYGLHAYVFSSNVPRANAVAARLEAGRVMVNTLQNDALAPFGGYKQSGFGRESACSAWSRFWSRRQLSPMRLPEVQKEKKRDRCVGSTSSARTKSATTRHAAADYPQPNPGH